MVHLNERGPELTRASAGGTPCVLARTSGGELVPLFERRRRGKRIAFLDLAQTPLGVQDAIPECGRFAAVSMGPHCSSLPWVNPGIAA